MKVTVVAVSLPALGEVCRYARRHPDICFLPVHVGQLSSPGREFLKDIPSSDAVLVDLMGVAQPLYGDIVSALRKCQGVRLCCGGMAPSLTRLGDYDEDDFGEDEEDEENARLINEAWKRAEPRDIEFVFDLVLGRYLRADGIPEPVSPDYHDGPEIKDPVTGRTWGSLGDFLRDNPHGPEKGTVDLFYNGNSYPVSTLPAVRELFAELREVADVVPISMAGVTVRNIGDVEALMGSPDVIISTQPFRFLVGPMGGDSDAALKVLKDAGAVLLKPMMFTGSTYEEWSSSDAGPDPMQFSLQIFLPELDGAVCTIPVGFSKETERFEDFGLTVREVEPDIERCRRIVGKTKGYLALRRKPNSEKKVAILSYNYPPGEGNLFGGSFLDGPGSISAVLSILADAGYTVGRMSSDEVLGAFLREGMVNDGQWISPTEKVIRFRGREEHPPEVGTRWGRAPGTVMTDDGLYLVPGIVDGNVFIGIQPPRAVSGDIAGTYHDRHLPPHHQYLAFYEYLRDVFKADVIVHVGTHGTLEFLPGKDSAMGGDCYPDRILGDIPHVYLYYSGNTSEAMIAKRRTHAGIVSYMGVPFVRSGLYGELVGLEEMIAELREAERTDAGRAALLKEELAGKAAEMRLPTDVEELDDELVTMRNSLIPQGLHVFGTAFSGPEAATYAANSLDFPHPGIPEIKEKIVHLGLSLDEVVRRYLEDGSVPESLAGDDDTEKVLRYARDTASRARSCDEAEGLLSSLEGRYIPAKPGGDPMKDPDVLPSGYNLVQFNPERIPTLVAFRRGFEAAQQTVGEFFRVNGRYPSTAAIVLWGLETSRTQGMSLGQICGYLGIEMVRDSGTFRDRFRCIPPERLGRPRTDVVISMCGFFRDMFPSLIDGIADLFSLIPRDEQNAISRNSARNRDFLSASFSGEDLEDLAGCRLFGPDRSEYGTGMTDVVGSSSWKDEKELGDIFTESLRFAYSRRFKCLDVPGLLAVNHSGVEVVTQVRDSADREIIDLDHYYEFLGGLTKAIENAKGDRPSVFVVDGSGPKVRTDTAERSAERGVRTRLLNPKWSGALLKVDYRGAQEINDRFENLVGLAATVGCISSGTFSDVFDTYVRDRDMREKVRRNNNWAYMSMLDRLSEADSRGYWDATDEQIGILKEAYLESEAKAEEDSDR